MIERSNAPGFTRATFYVRALVRADGQPGLDKAYQPSTGDSLSPFIVLKAR
jgi:hypothetical protein